MLFPDIVLVVFFFFFFFVSFFFLLNQQREDECSKVSSLATLQEEEVIGFWRFMVQEN